MQMTFAFRKRSRVLGLLAVLPVLTTVFCSTLTAQGPKKTPQHSSVGALAASECDAEVSNIVANCGFESGVFGPWTFSGVDSLFNYVSGGGHSGSFGAFLGSVGGLGCITQTLTTLGTANYTLSFWLNNNSIATGIPASGWIGLKMHWTIIRRFGEYRLMSVGIGANFSAFERNISTKQAM